MSRKGERTRLRNRSRYGLLLTLGAAALAALALFGAGGPAGAANGGGKGLWQRVDGKPGPARQGAKPAVNPRSFDALRLDRAGHRRLPRGRADRARADEARLRPRHLPPRSERQLPGLRDRGVAGDGARTGGSKHPEITTYAGRGIDDPTATIRADLTPLGFHASVRSKDGAWYIDPYYQLDDSLYASYYGRAVRDEPQGVFVERDADSADLSVDRGYYLADDTVTLSGSGYGESKAVTITISDPAGGFADRTLVRADGRSGQPSRRASPPTLTATSTRTSSRLTTAAPPPRRATRSSVRSRASTRRPATSAAPTAWR